MGSFLLRNSSTCALSNWTLLLGAYTWLYYALSLHLVCRAVVPFWQMRHTQRCLQWRWETWGAFVQGSMIMDVNDCFRPGKENLRDGWSALKGSKSTVKGWWESVTKFGGQVTCSKKLFTHKYYIILWLLLKVSASIHPYRHKMVFEWLFPSLAVTKSGLAFIYLVIRVLWILFV